jgi:3-phosphoshikimate 1-carboxyvinyltransferase
MNYTVNPNFTYQGLIQIPPSKSDSQRAILAAGLALGTSIISNVGLCNDENAMLQVIQQLGAKVSIIDNKHHITGTHEIPMFCKVDINESGLAARLLSGVFACSDGTQTIQGKGSVLTRKFNFFPKHQSVFQNKVTLSEFQTLPITFEDKIQTDNIVANGGESSQDISGLLYGLCFLQKEINFKILHLNSRPYLQMTLATLKHFGITVEHVNFEDFTILKNTGFQACNYTIEGDWSAASFWLVASALGKDIGIDGLQLNSLQADKQILSILRAANCSEIRSQFLTIDGEKRTTIDVDLTHCPDLFPILTTYAALTPGVSKLHGTHRLLNKESNRTFSLIEEFSKLDVEIYTENDTLIIHGKDTISGGKVNSHNDHRIAMCLAIAGLFADSSIEIENSTCVTKSYPQFWEHLEQIKVLSND